MAGPDWIDLIRLLFEGFEILVIDCADYINKHSALAIRCMNRDGRGHAPFGENDYRCCNQSHPYSPDASLVGQVLINALGG
jgi:hypothetical protein